MNKAVKIIATLAAMLWVVSIIGIIKFHLL